MAGRKRITHTFHPTDIAKLAQMSEPALRRSIARNNLPLQIEVGYSEISAACKMREHAIRNHVYRGQLDITSLQDIICFILAFARGKARYTAFAAMLGKLPNRPPSDLMAVVCFVCQHAPADLVPALFDALTRQGRYEPAGNRDLERRGKSAKKKAVSKKRTAKKR